MTPLQRAICLALVSALLGCLGAAASKHIAPVTGIATLIASQYLISALLLAPSYARHAQWQLPRTIWGWHIIRGAAGFFCFLLFYTALQHIPLADSVLLRNAAPLWVPLLGLGIGIRIDWRTVPPIVLGLIGIALMMKPGQDGISHWHVIGCLSGLAFGVAMLATRELVLREPQPRILMMYFLISLAFALPWAAWEWQPIAASSLLWLGAIGVCLFGSLRLFTHAYSLASAQQVSPIAYTSVLFAGLLDWWFWQHEPDTFTLAGMGLVISSGIMLAWHRKPKAL
ncbi:MAG TPA: DMT family transporter [Pseudomonadales bacterium]